MFWNYLRKKRRLKKQSKKIKQFIAEAKSKIEGQGTVSILTVTHNWTKPLVDVAPHFIDERRAVAKRLVQELCSFQRESLGQMDPKGLKKKMDVITRVLLKPAFGPLVNAQNQQPMRTILFGVTYDDLDTVFARRSPRVATNIGFEIECSLFTVDGRKKQDPLKIVHRLLIKCMVEEQPGGFSVQTDSGYIELVSDIPKASSDPVKTAAAMATYTEKLHSELLSLQNGDPTQNQPWQPARSVVPPFKRHVVSMNGGGTSELEVRFVASGFEGVPISGTFHVTTGIHLSAIPWLFSTVSGLEVGKILFNFPLPGKAFLRDDVRDKVLNQLHELRKGARRERHSWSISPQFEGLAFLILTYVATAQVPEEHMQARTVLSPKQLFLVLARTDFAKMLRLCPEFAALASGRQSLRRLKTYRDLLLGVMDKAGERLFTDTFKRKVHPNELAKENKDDLLAHDVQITPKQWLTELFDFDNSVDILTPQYQAKTTEKPPQQPDDLFRGMGELGDKVDQIPGAEANSVEVAPIFELRRLTVGDKNSSTWEAFAKHIVGVVSELNCPADEDDKRSAAEELEWLRLAGRPRVPNGGQKSRRAAPTQEDEQAVDLICALYRKRMGDATMRAELWTLLDQARSHIEARPLARKK